MPVHVCKQLAVMNALQGILRLAVIGFEIVYVFGCHKRRTCDTRQCDDQLIHLNLRRRFRMMDHLQKKIVCAKNVLIRAHKLFGLFLIMRHQCLRDFSFETTG